MNTRWTLAHMPRLDGRIAVVTGANSGLGLETAIALATVGARVVMACRDPQRAAPALEALRARVPRATAELMALDLADLASVRRFADEFATRHARLDLLVCNAGVMALPLQKTRDGFEMQIGTNHLGHFALSGLLLPQLDAAAAARIVVVASVAHRAAKRFDPEDLNGERGRYNKAQAYARSKLANLLFSFELNRRLKAAGSKVLAVAAHPGYAATNIGFAGAPGQRAWLSKLAIRIGNLLLAQPAAMGALPTLYAATLPTLKGGEFVGPQGPLQFRGHPVEVDCIAVARDAALAARLWTKSEQLTGVQYLSKAG